MFAYHLKKILDDIRNYPNLDYGQRHIFWRKLQALLFMVLFPLFLCLGLLSRALKLIRNSRNGISPGPFRKSGADPKIRNSGADPKIRNSVSKIGG